MKKETLVIDEKKLYKLETLIRRTALMKSATGKTGLINIKNNEVVGSFDFFDHEISDEDYAFFFQEKWVKDKESDHFERKRYLRIYDTLNEKIVADNWLICGEIKDDYYNLSVLQDPKTKKYHLFNKDKYRTDLNIFDIPFDEIKFLYNYCGDKYLSLSKDGKKRLYFTKEGLVDRYEFADIQAIGSGAMVFNDGDSQFFTCVNYVKRKIFRSPLFKEIKSDENNSNIIYCKSDAMTEIYYAKEYDYKFLFKAPICDDIKCIKSINASGEVPEEYIFLIEKNKKYGLISGVVNKDEKNKVSCKPLTNVEYDEIEYKDGDFFLKKGDKQGLFVWKSKKGHLINADYDKIVPIWNGDYYALFNGETWDIINLTNQKIVVGNCNIIENFGDTIIYEKNGKKGIFRSLDDNKCTVLDGYDDIKRLGGRYYLVTKNGKKGIIFDTETIIKPKYKEIEINGFHKYKGFDVFRDAKELYFALKKSDGNYDLAKLVSGKYACDKKQLEFLNSERFTDIKLFDSIMVFRDANNTYVYSYDEKLLKTYPKDAEISETTVKDMKKEMALYFVNGAYYLYKDGNFEVAPIEDCKMYVTSYERPYGTVVVNSYDKQKHDEMCMQIENDGEECFDNTLISIYENNPKIKEKYPTLIKRPRSGSKNNFSNH